MTRSSGRRPFISRHSGRPSPPGMAVARQETLQRRLAGKSEVQHVNALAHLAAKALAEQIGDIGLVINDQNADCHGTLTTSAEGYDIAAPARGRRIVNSVKAPTALSTAIVPLCCCVTMS